MNIDIQELVERHRYQMKHPSEDIERLHRELRSMLEQCKPFGCNLSDVISGPNTIGVKLMMHGSNGSVHSFPIGFDWRGYTIAGKCGLSLSDVAHWVSRWIAAILED